MQKQRHRSVRSKCKADQRLCFPYRDSTILVLSKYKISRALAIFCGCTAWFVSDLVRNHIVGFLMRRLKFDLIIVGVVYLKNMISQFWQDREVENPSDPVPFNIHEQDRLAIRNNIVEAIIHAPDPIRYVTPVTLYHSISMNKKDWPSETIL